VGAGSGRRGIAEIYACWRCFAEASGRHAGAGAAGFVEGSRRWRHPPGAISGAEAERAGIVTGQHGEHEQFSATQGRAEAGRRVMRLLGCKPGLRDVADIGRGQRAIHGAAGGGRVRAARTRLAEGRRPRVSRPAGPGGFDSEGLAGRSSRPGRRAHDPCLAPGGRLEISPLLVNNVPRRFHAALGLGCAICTRHCGTGARVAVIARPRQGDASHGPPRPDLLRCELAGSHRQTRAFSISRGTPILAVFGGPGGPPRDCRPANPPVVRFRHRESLR